MKIDLTSFELNKLVAALSHYTNDYGNDNELEALITKLHVINDTTKNDDDDIEIIVGQLNKTFGYNGCKLVEIGTDVFESKDKYFFYVEQLNGQKYKNIFNKITLQPVIDFI